MIQHKELAAGRWYTMPLAEQMGNIGSEVHRAIVAYEKKDNYRKESATVRALELFDLTLDDPRWHTGRREIARSREIFCDLFYGDNIYGTVANQLDNYFLEFAAAARSSK